MAAALGCRVATMAVALAIRPLKLGEPGALLTGLRTGMTGVLVGRVDGEAAAAGAFPCPPCCFAAGAWLPAALPREAGAGLRFPAAPERDAAALPGSLAAAALPRAGVDTGLRAAALPAAALPGAALPEAALRDAVLLVAALPGLRAAADLAGAGARLPALATVVGFFTPAVFFTPPAFFTAGLAAALAALLAGLRAGLAARAGAAFAAVFFAAVFTAGLAARAGAAFRAGLPPLAAGAADDFDPVALRPDPLDFAFVCTLSELKRPLFFAISFHHCIGRGGRVL